MLCLVKTYHFVGAYVCFTKDDADEGFIGRLTNLPIIINDIIYDLRKIDERIFRDHVIQLHESQQQRKKEFEAQLAAKLAA